MKPERTPLDKMVRFQASLSGFDFNCCLIHFKLKTYTTSVFLSPSFCFDSVHSKCIALQLFTSLVQSFLALFLNQVSWSGR